MRQSEKQLCLITAKRPSLAERVCLYIHNCTPRQLGSLNETVLAEIFNIPREKLCKRFERKMQRPLDTFLCEMKVLQVCKSLEKEKGKAPNFPNVANQLGFPGYLDFYVLFYTLMQITPHNYYKTLEKRTAKQISVSNDLRLT
jgi:hypothetical protein